MKKAAIAYIATVLLFGVIYTALIFNSSVTPMPDPRVDIEDDIYYINLNTATADDLQQIPGIGPKTADNIIQYRNENGPYSEYAELLNVKGISTKVLAVIMDYVRII
jgi:comEA protein